MLFQNTLLALLVGTAVVAFPGYPEKSTCSAGKFTYGKNADIDTLTIFKCTKRRRKSPRRRRHISRPRPSTSPSLPSAASSPRRLYPMPLQVLGLPPRYFSLPQHYQHSLTILDCHQVQDEDWDAYLPCRDHNLHDQIRDQDQREDWVRNLSVYVSRPHSPHLFTSSLILHSRPHSKVTTIYKTKIETCPVTYITSKTSTSICTETKTKPYTISYVETTTKCDKGGWWWLLDERQPWQGMTIELFSQFGETSRM